MACLLFAKLAYQCWATLCFFMPKFLLITATAIQLSLTWMLHLLFFCVVMTPLLMSANWWCSHGHLLIELSVLDNNKWAISTFVDRQQTVTVLCSCFYLSLLLPRANMEVSMSRCSCVLFSSALYTELATDDCCLQKKYSLVYFSSTFFPFLLLHLSPSSFPLRCCFALLSHTIDACCYCGIWLVNDLGQWWMMAS